MRNQCTMQQDVLLHFYSTTKLILSGAHILLYTKKVENVPRSYKYHAKKDTAEKGAILTSINNPTQCKINKNICIANNFVASSSILAQNVNFVGEGNFSLKKNVPRSYKKLHAKNGKPQKK